MRAGSLSRRDEEVSCGLSRAFVVVCVITLYALGFWFATACLVCDFPFSFAAP